ncbi:MAG: phosphate/phosphite/phosphonate ABC transporter substrate-binding protein [Candidatus Hydrogenedentes bacterium]|nr:phosphate/phosphite/phosphonate ABC transporter substrate-binding protein [Candidatus Hydrogenedentota bacterium]
MSDQPRCGKRVAATACLAAAGLSLTLCVAGCAAQEEVNYSPIYEPAPDGRRSVLIFGVHPLHNPQRLYEAYGPLIDYLNAQLPDSKLELEASRSYDEYDKKLYSRHFDFALPNPYQTINALPHGYRVFGKMGEDQEFRGVILVRKDSGIERVADLKGKTVSFPAPTALAATMMPLYYLHTHGVDVNRDIERLFAGSQESSIMNVYLGKSAAGATWPPPWKAFVERNPQIASELEVKWETPSLINNALVVRDDVPEELVDRVASILFALHTHDTGRNLLAALVLARFESASNMTYQPVNDFLKQYREVVR